MYSNANACRPRLILLENSLHKTGAFNSALYIAKALHYTHDVELVIPTSSKLHSDLSAAGIVCHRLPMVEVGRSWRKLLLYIPILAFNALNLHRLLIRRNATVLMVNDYYNMLGVCVRLTGWGGKILTVVRLLPANQHRLLNRIWTTLGMMFTHHMIAVSGAVARQLPSDPKVVLLYNPIGLTEKYSSFFKRTGGAGDGLIYCLYPANYIAGKGHGTALEAFARAYRDCPSLRLRFVGGDMGLEKNRDLKAELLVKAAQLRVQDVVIVDGFSADIELDIKNSDIILNFSESESFSHTCIEASAFGKPIIATRCGGPEEIVENDVTGLLVDIGDLPAMVAAILRLANSPSTRQNMGEAGRLAVWKKFSERSFLDGFHSLLSSSS